MIAPLRARNEAWCRLGARPPRRGVMVVVSLICLLVASLLTASLVRLTHLQARQQAAVMAEAQAEWLAESASQRALARLQLDPTYPGERWVPRGPAGSEAVGEAEIGVSRLLDQPGLVKLSISATCLTPQGWPCRRQRELVLPAAGAPPGAPAGLPAVEPPDSP